MALIDIAIFTPLIMLTAWTWSHPYFDETGNEKNFNYDTAAALSLGLAIGGYFLLWLPFLAWLRG